MSDPNKQLWSSTNTKPVSNAQQTHLIKNFLQNVTIWPSRLFTQCNSLSQYNIQTFSHALNLHTLVQSFRKTLGLTVTLLWPLDTEASKSIFFAWHSGSGRYINYRTKFSYKRFRGSEDVVRTNINRNFKPALWPWCTKQFNLSKDMIYNGVPSN